MPRQVQGARLRLRCRLIRPLKGHLLWDCTLSAMEELRQALLKCSHRHNGHWQLERHNFHSPSQAQQELMQSRQAA